MGKRYFISHRHSDKEIARAIKTNLETWNIASEEIFLSSDARTALTVGEEVLAGIREAATDTKLLILVYTSQADDWSWCMWECGLVEDPASVKTRVVVLQCSADVPEVFKGRLRVVMDTESIAAFVAQFHRDEHFLPDEQPFFPEVSDDAIRQKAQRLYDDINGVLPQTEKTVRRWSYFRLLLRREAVDSLREIDDSKNINVDSLSEVASVVDSSGLALPHFGYADDTRDISLAELADRWRQVVRSPNSKWVDKLCAEMWRGVNNYTPKLKWRPINSAQGEGNYSILMIVNQVDFRKDGAVEFSVNTYKAPLSSEQIATDTTTSTLWAGAV